MQIPFERWHDAIQIRKSRRKFLNKAIPNQILQKIEGFLKNFRPFGDVAYGVLVTVSPNEVFRGSIGSYGIITGAQAYIAFIGKTTDPQVEEKVGYVGEGIILEATALDLNTCWVGGFFKPEVVAKHIDLKDGERVYAITPIGYSAEDLTFTEKLMSSLAKSKQRKDLTTLCSGLSQEKWATWQETAILNAQIAPSAVNRQPWHFTIGEGEIVLSVDNPGEPMKNLAKRLDCGIALLHLEVGAMRAGKMPQVEILENPQVARVKV